MIRKILLAAGAAALMSTPAWAHPGQAPSNHGNGHGPSAPNNDNHGNQGNDQGKDNGNDQGKKGHGKGHSHKCLAHKVGYVAGGTLVKQTLTKNSNGTYSGEVEVMVMHTNRHAVGDKGKTVKYALENARVTFGMPDTNKDGSVGLDDVVPGDRTHVIGKITALAPRCEAKEFTAVTTVRKVVFHAPLSK